MKNIIFISLITLQFLNPIFAQEDGRPLREKPEGNGSLSGTIIDEYNGNPIEYANIAIYSLKDSTIVTGGITNNKGYFLIENIPFGRYFVELNFLGYNKQRIDMVMINPREPNQDIGKIKLSAAAEMLGEIEIEAEKARVEYKLDRKVINVEKDLNAVGGSAVDVLENVPSVQTDIDGNVSLRGSGNFLVLIDGRPSPLEGSEALQQIPSSSIESIEIITNPSAKFDPDGVGGIINVILKKERREGINGQFSVSYGSYNSLSADALVNIRTNKINWFVGLDINKRTNIGEGLFEQRTYGADTLVVNKQSIGERGRNGGKIRAGFDYYISDNDILTFSGQYGKNGFGRISIDTAQSYYISNNTHTNEYFYLSDNVFDISGNFWAGDINYVHKFMKKGHEIQAYAYYSSDFDSELNKYVETGYENQLYNQIINSDSTRTTEKSNVDDIRMKLDYTLPLFTEGKLEAGYQVKQRFSDNQYLYQLGGPNDQWIDSSELSNNYTFDRNIQSGYLTFSNITGKFGYMLGLRTEYTYRVLHQSQITQDFDSVYNKFNFFPTLHISYKMPWDLQVLASYSRRIQRPRGHFLDPFPEVVDPYNIKQGNPMLEPEFTNAAELNLQKTFGSNYISFEAYFRETSNKIERIKTVSETNSEIIISTFENIGEDMSAGGELMTNISFTKWWNFNLSGDVYYYKITGNDLSNVSTNSTINWGVRTNQTFRIKKTNSSIQLSGFYHGPNITSQGTTKGMGMVNIAFRQDFLDRRLSLTLNLRDIFGTMNHEFIYNTPTFYSYNLFDRKSPTFNFTITYRLNDYKRRKDNIDGPELESGDDAGM